MSDNKELSYEDLMERVIRLIIFNLFFMILLKFTNRLDNDIFIISGMASISFMIVNTYYPIVIFGRV